MMSSTEIQAGLSSILDRLNGSLSTAERDALYEALDGGCKRSLRRPVLIPFASVLHPSQVSREGWSTIYGESALPHALPARQPAPITQQK